MGIPSIGKRARWYSASSISLRMKLVNGVLIALAVSILSMFAYAVFTAITMSNIKELNAVILAEIKQKLNSRFSQLEKTLLNASRDYRIQEYLSPGGISDRDIYLFFNEFISYHKYRVETSSMSFDVDLISDFFFFNPRKDFIVSISQPVAFKSVELGQLLRLGVFKRALQDPDRNVWSEVIVNPVEESRVGGLALFDRKNLELAINQLMVLRYVTKSATSSGIGYIGAAIGLDKLANMLIYAKADSETSLYIVDQDRRVIASGDRQMILKILSLDPESDAAVMKANATGVRSARIDGKEVFLHYAGLDVNHWKLFLVVPKPHYLKQVIFIRDLLLVVGGIFLLLLLAAEGWLARQIARPLESIVSRMSSIRDLQDIGSGFEVARRDGPREITELAENFSGLLSRIDELNSRIEEEGRVKRQAELHALQVQINPHFVYNSLDSIRWLTLAGKKQETVRMIDGLSRFFRLGLSGGKEKVRIGQELEHVESYLEVQKIRFAERLEYMIDVEPCLLGLSILKIVLQPLVENSLTHGMKGRPGIFVKVRGGLENGLVRFEVVDDGCGMEELTVSTLNLLLAQEVARRSAPDQDHGFGLCNVDSRLKLHYGKDYGLRVASCQGTGTKVIVRIPAEP